MYTSSQTFTFGAPPSVGIGAAYSLKRSPKFNLLVVDKYNLNVTSKDQYSNQNNLSYSVDVRKMDGSYATYGSGYAVDIKDPNYTFSYEDNVQAFSGTPRREYKLVFKLYETSPATVSSGQYTVYHNAAQISGISGVLDGTLITGGNRNRTGSIDINLSMANSSYYTTSKFEIYTGSSSSFTAVTGTGVGANLLKTVSVFDQNQNYTLTIKEGEQPSDDRYYFYKILPYDDFGSGVLFTSPSSGKMYSLAAPTFVVDNMTGKSVVLLNDSAYCIQTYHSGAIFGTGYNLVDRILNVSGNIISGGWYMAQATGDVAQSATYPFKTIKYLAQVTDSNRSVSSREILITDNSTSSDPSLRTGIIYSEFASSDSSKSVQLLVSGSGYNNGTGHICLLAKLTNPSGTFKLFRTIL